MSAPPLPDAFGNYALGDFVEVVSPQAVSWLPQTAGWWWLAAALLVAGLYFGWKRLRHWYRNRYRREAMARMTQLQTAQHGNGLTGEINKLLKLAAMAAYSREEVASLSGDDWVKFLNKCCGPEVFSAEQGRLLAEGVYRAEPPAAADGQLLIEASLRWLQNHRTYGDV